MEYTQIEQLGALATKARNELYRSKTEGAKEEKKLKTKQFNALTYLVKGIRALAEIDRLREQIKMLSKYAEEYKQAYEATGIHAPDIVELRDINAEELSLFYRQPLPNKSPLVKKPKVKKLPDEVIEAAEARMEARKEAAESQEHLMNSESLNDTEEEYVDMTHYARQIN